MKINKRTLCASVLLSSAALATSILPAHATGDPTQLDQGDFTIACRSQYGQQGWQAHLYGSTIADWKCFYNDGWPWSVWTSERKSINVTSYCVNNLGMTYASWRDVNDPNSWYCG